MSKFIIVEIEENISYDPKCETYCLQEIANVFGVKKQTTPLDKEELFFEQAQKADKIYKALKKSQKIIDDFCREPLGDVVDAVIDYRDKLEVIKNDLIMLL